MDIVDDAGGEGYIFGGLFGVLITALDNCVLTLTSCVHRYRFAFPWQTVNPGEYPTYVHIGTPPVIGEDGIFYGFYESPDLESVPITPASEKAEWKTDVVVPDDVKGFYIMLSVESKKQRLFVNYALDISDR
jgi:hypothetical protein